MLKAYEENADYRWLVQKCRELSSEQVRRSGIEYVIHYPEALRFFIDKNLYVDMRRHTLRSEKYLDAFRRYRKVAERLSPCGKAPAAGNETGVSSARPRPSAKASPIGAGSSGKRMPKKEAEKKTGKRRAAPVNNETAPEEKKERERRPHPKAVPATGKKADRKKKRRTLPEGQMSLFDIDFAAN